MSIRILLADDHKIIRDGLQSLIDRESDMQVVGMADNGRETVRLARELTPDVIVMDISMPDLNGIEATRQIKADRPDAKVVALSIHTDKRFVVRMLQAGASAYLMKDCAFDELVQAIHTVLAGKTYLSPEITTVVVQDIVQQTSDPDTSAIDVLSDREREVLQLLAEGKTTKQIASDLYVSVKTIESHRLNIMKKLGIHSLADLIKLAIREGLTSL